MEILLWACWGVLAVWMASLWVGWWRAADKRRADLIAEIERLNAEERALTDEYIGIQRERLKIMRERATYR